MLTSIQESLVAHLTFLQQVVVLLAKGILAVFTAASKMVETTEHLNVDDIVLIMDHPLTQNDWQLGRVT